MSKTISSHTELKAVLKALPQAPGTVRVYRGQTNDHPTLTPGGLRRSLRKQVIWLTYSHILYQSLLPEFLRKSGKVNEEMLLAFGLWFHAVAQHYGPGSDFLDVTHSLDVALWFALNKYETVQAHGVIGPPGPPDPRQDHPTAGEMVKYSPSNSVGYLYVFDLPKWNGERLPEVGALVDVAEAPEVFSSSVRMRNQAACLVYCRDKNFDHLDLKKKHLVGGAPIIVQRPLAGAVGLDRKVSDLFPSPEQDAWYARLLSVPMSYAPAPAPPKLRRVIPVAVYFDEQNPRYAHEVRFRDVLVPPPLLHRWVRDAAPAAGPSDPVKSMAQAVPIVLEAPVLFPYPSGDSNLWHQGLLASDLADRGAVYDVEGRSQTGEVSLTNVLFEFSPLETAGWDRIVRNEAPVHLLRGVWLRRREAAGEFDAGLVYQDVPGSGPDTFIFFGLHYDPTLEEFLIVPRPGRPPIPVSQNPEMANQICKPVFVALMLLRHLSPALKAEASPQVQANIEENGQSKSLYIISCSRDAARLGRVPAAPHPDWFVLRDWGSPEEPFTHARQPDGTLELKAQTPFNKIPVATIRGKLP